VLTIQLRDLHAVTLIPFKYRHRGLLKFAREKFAPIRLPVQFSAFQAKSIGSFPSDKDHKGL
jgi:hypothetical protein